MIKNIFAATILGASLVATTPTFAADSCGYFAFAGAFSTYNRAQRQANRVGGNVWSLDHSNSPNAGRGLWVVARGPGSSSRARSWARTYRNRGVGGAYVANRCFYGE